MFVHGIMEFQMIYGKNQGDVKTYDRTLLINAQCRSTTIKILGLI